MARWAGVVVAVVAVGLAAFEVALAAGAPLGRAAWGGGSATLGPTLRAASAVTALVWAGLALVVLRQVGVGVWAPVPVSWGRVVVWIFAGYCALGVLMNLISRSPIERSIMAPVSLVLAVALTLVATRAAR